MSKSMERSAAAIAPSLGTNTAISARGIAKQYVLGGAEQNYDSFRDLLRGALTAPLKKYKTLSGQDKRNYFWALKDIDFDIPEGQITGVIGRNGAGKSTLLKVLSKITDPTLGQIEIRGRVASLLEVGSGFHPELTGRENIYMNASILGMRRREVHKKLDDIVQFAEVEKFLDTPVKRYSSGMYVRLAFSVAAHVDPDVLLVDEVLAVGDTKFQQRCIGKLNEVGKQGRTVMFVSHNMALVSELCTHSIYLRDGEIVVHDKSNIVLEKYMSDSSTTTGEIEVKGKALEKLSFSVESRGETSFVDFNESAVICVAFSDQGGFSDYVIELTVSDSIGREIYSSFDKDSTSSITNRKAVGNCVQCELPSSMLRPGKYIAKVAFRALRHGHTMFFEEAELAFDVAEAGYNIKYRREGLISPILKWQNLT